MIVFGYFESKMFDPESDFSKSRAKKYFLRFRYEKWFFDNSSHKK